MIQSFYLPSPFIKGLLEGFLDSKFFENVLRFAVKVTLIMDAHLKNPGAKIQI